MQEVGHTAVATSRTPRAHLTARHSATRVRTSLLNQRQQPPTTDLIKKINKVPQTKIKDLDCDDQISKHGL